MSRIAEITSGYWNLKIGVVISNDSFVGQLGWGEGRQGNQHGGEKRTFHNTDDGVRAKR